MKKTELITAVAAKSGMTKKDVEKTLAAVIDTLTEALVKGDKVTLAGLGAFEIKIREARMARNPKTKEPIEVPATRVPVFKASTALKEAVAK
jgi:DNA-binding protein HU-beta